MTDANELPTETGSGGIALPEVGKTYALQNFGDATVVAVRKRGKPRKDGTFGGTVEYHGFDGEKRRMRLRAWEKAVAA